MDADLVILDKQSLDIVHVISKGRQFVKDGHLLIKSEQEQLVEAAEQ
jgi:hypothetical protein